MHENLLHLHYLGDKLLPITARLQATISTVTKLEMLSREFHAAQSDTNTQTSTGFIELANDAAYRKARLEGLISGGEILGKKVKDVLNMVRHHETSIELVLCTGRLMMTILDGGGTEFANEQ